MSGTGETVLLVAVLLFGSVALASYTLLGAFAGRERTRQRFGTLSAVPFAGNADEAAAARPPFGLDPALLGLDAAAQRKLRRELVRAGIFEPSAVPLYALARLVLLVALPLLGYGLAGALLPWLGAVETALALVLLVAVAAYLPPAVLARRQRAAAERYRLAFPDFLDMLVVCIHAGLSLDAALDRVARELGSGYGGLRRNLELMAGEKRAGRSMPEALRDFADRLGIREARSFAALLTQTLELGTDVAQALRTFSDEMRDKRMSRAEERAAALGPKLTVPLALFIFPVVLIVVLTPAVLRILGALRP